MTAAGEFDLNISVIVVSTELMKIERHNRRPRVERLANRLSASCRLQTHFLTHLTLFDRGANLPSM